MTGAGVGQAQHERETNRSVTQNRTIWERRADWDKTAMAEWGKPAPTYVIYRSIPSTDKRLIEMVNGDTSTFNNAEPRLLGQLTGDTGDFGQESIEVTDHGAAAGDNHSLIHNVGGQFRWCFL